jgi:hypothetical protein
MVTTQTSSAAKRLGKSGGKATASKRTPQQRSEAARKAANALWEKRRRDKSPDPFIFERVLCNGWFSPKKSDHYFGAFRVAPLVKAGFAVFDREDDKLSFPAHYYRPTATGVNWWINQRIEDYASYTHSTRDVAILAPYIGGKGIGCTVEIPSYIYGPSIFLALRDGLLELASYRDYSGMAHWTSEYITVRLTEKGYRFFASLPTLVEVWE